MTTEWVKELVNDLRSAGYEVPIVNGNYRVYRRGVMVRNPNGQPVTVHTSPHPSPQARKNTIANLIQAGVFAEDPRVARQRQSLPKHEKQALKEARARVAQMKRQERLAAKEEKMAEKQTQTSMRMKRLADRAVEASQKLGSRAHIGALMMDRDPAEFTSLESAGMFIKQLVEGVLPSTSANKRRMDLLEKVLDWLHDQDAEKLRNEYKAKEHDRRSAAQKAAHARKMGARKTGQSPPPVPPQLPDPERRTETVEVKVAPDIYEALKDGMEVNALIRELTRTLRWLNDRIGA